MTSKIDQCTKCTICNAYCPVFKATSLFPGPKLSGPDAERFRAKGNILPAEWIEFCDYCKTCERVCPHGVPIAELHIRSRMKGRGRRRSFRDWLLGHAYFMEKLGAWTPFSNWVFRQAFFRWVMDHGMRLDRRAPMPSYTRKTFARWHRSQNLQQGIPIAYFHGCYTNYVDPDIGRAVVRVLEKNGFQVTLPPQECCGLPLIGNGFFRSAARLGKKNINSLGMTIERGIDVVFSSPSCGMTLREEYRDLLDLPGASVLEDHLFDIFQCLLGLHEQGKMNTRLKEVKETFYYHAPCHLRSLNIGLPALDILSLVPGLRVIELPEGCCGLAGSYGFKREKYAISRDIGEEIFRAVRERKAGTVISECEACRLQIGHHTGVRTLHPIQVLRQAYGA